MSVDVVQQIKNSVQVGASAADTASLLHSLSLHLHSLTKSSSEDPLITLFRLRVAAPLFQDCIALLTHAVNNNTPVDTMHKLLHTLADLIPVMVEITCTETCLDESLAELVRQVLSKFSQEKTELEWAIVSTALKFNDSCVAIGVLRILMESFLKTKSGFDKMDKFMSGIEVAIDNGLTNFGTKEGLREELLKCLECLYFLCQSRAEGIIEKLDIDNMLAFKNLLKASSEEHDSASKEESFRYKKSMEKLLSMDLSQPQVEVVDFLKIPGNLDFFMRYISRLDVKRTAKGLRTEEIIFRPSQVDGEIDMDQMNSFRAMKILLSFSSQSDEKTSKVAVDKHVELLKNNLSLIVDTHLLSCLEASSSSNVYHVCKIISVLLDQDWGRQHFSKLIMSETGFSAILPVFRHLDESPIIDLTAKIICMFPEELSAHCLFESLVQGLGNAKLKPMLAFLLERCLHFFILEIRCTRFFMERFKAIVDFVFYNSPVVLDVLTSNLEDVGYLKVLEAYLLFVNAMVQADDAKSLTGLEDRLLTLLDVIQCPSTKPVVLVHQLNCLSIVMLMYPSSVQKLREQKETFGLLKNLMLTNWSRPLVLHPASVVYRTIQDFGPESDACLLELQEFAQSKNASDLRAIIAKIQDSKPQVEVN